MKLSEGLRLHFKATLTPWCQELIHEAEMQEKHLDELRAERDHLRRALMHACPVPGVADYWLKMTESNG